MVETCNNRFDNAFWTSGYAVCPGLVPQEVVEALKLECEVLQEMAISDDPGTQEPDLIAENRGCILQVLPGISNSCAPSEGRPLSPQQYLQCRSQWPYQAKVAEFLRSQPLLDVLCAVLGDNVCLYNEQFISKPAGSRGSAFQWHRDSQECNDSSVDCKPYVSVWVALDDMSPDNGPLVVLPGSHRQQAVGAHKRCTRLPEIGMVASAPDSPLLMTGAPAVAAGSMLAPGCTQWTNPAGSHEQGVMEAVGGSLPGRTTRAGGPAQCLGCPATPAVCPQASGMALLVKAGTAVVFSDQLLHCSGPNFSCYSRRAWMPQFSAGPILYRDSGRPVAVALDWADWP